MAERPFSRHLRGDYSPAKCIRTGRDTDLIDLGGEDIPGYGRVYLQVLEVAELAQQLGFIDAAASEATIRALRSEIQNYKDRLAAASSGDTASVIRKLERLTSDLRDTADDLQRLTPADPGRGSNLYLLPVDKAAEPASSGADRVPVEDNGDRPAAATKQPRKRGGAASAKPVPVRQDDANIAVGSATAAGADPEVDGPGIDASFEWVQRDDETPHLDPAIDSDHAGN